MTFEPSFVTAADPQFLRYFYRTYYEAGAQEVGIADSMGVAKPSTIRYLTRLVRESVPVPVGIHAHHDFGMSVGLSLAALEEGAQRAAVGVMGLGERAAGGTPLEEIVPALEGLYGIDTEQLATWWGSSIGSRASLYMPPSRWWERTSSPRSWRST